MSGDPDRQLIEEVSLDYAAAWAAGEISRGTQGEMEYVLARLEAALDQRDERDEAMAAAGASVWMDRAQKAEAQLRREQRAADAESEELSIQINALKAELREAREAMAEEKARADAHLRDLRARTDSAFEFKDRAEAAEAALREMQELCSRGQACGAIARDFLARTREPSVPGDTSQSDANTEPQR